MGKNPNMAIWALFTKIKLTFFKKTYTKIVPTITGGMTTAELGEVRGGGGAPPGCQTAIPGCPYHGTHLGATSPRTFPNAKQSTTHKSHTYCVRGCRTHRIVVGIRALLTAQASTGESYSGNRPNFGPSGRGHYYCYFSSLCGVRLTTSNRANHTRNGRFLVCAFCAAPGADFR